ncbi:hypothetical protein [Kitasatospora sp. NPDC088783]|uniref:hypothetical protein n=1 Tax=Kitasatospora sp. NPDC088783 TaxID=3364077 RepID=UPI0038302D24
MFRNLYLRALLRGIVGSVVVLVLSRLTHAVLSPAAATLVDILVLIAAVAVQVVATIADGRRRDEVDSARED